MTDPRTYRTGSPRDYLLGLAMLALAAWVGWEFANAEHLHEIDRPIMALIAILTFGGIGVVAIMRAGLSAIIVSDERIRVREWTGVSRCFPTQRLARVIWSYRYAGGVGSYDQGRAWLELQFHDAEGERDVAVVDYAGRSRHAAVEALTLDLARRAGLSWDSHSDSMDATDLPAAEVIFERRRGVPDAGG
jgi:hypothetical protein